MGCEILSTQTTERAGSSETIFFFYRRYNPLWVCILQPTSWLQPPRVRGFLITNNDTPQSVGLLWTSDQSVAGISTLQHTTLTTDKHPCPRWDSNPRSQQASGSRPTPQTARLLGPALRNYIKGVPLATEPSISLIILPLKKILQQLGALETRTTGAFLFVSHTTNVLLFKFRCNIFIGVRIIKEMLGSVASWTHCIYQITV